MSGHGKTTSCGFDICLMPQMECGVEKWFCDLMRGLIQVFVAFGACFFVFSTREISIVPKVR